MANIYTIELDGEIIELESNTEPTAEAVRAALGTTAPITADSSIGEVATTALGNVIPDAKNLVKGAASMFTPSGAVQAMEGMIDLGSSGISKLVDELGLAKYANPQQMEKYRKYRSVIADEFNELATEGGIKKRLAEKPVTSLLDLSVLGRGITLPLKAQQYSSGLQKAGEIGSKISGAIDPTQIITKPAGMAFDKIKNAADIKKAQMADVDAKLAQFTEEGFVVPPSSTKQAGNIRKSAESLFGDTKNKAI